MKCGIYSIRNITNGKRYIGQSTNLEDRKRSHFTTLKRGNHFNIYLQRAFLKYGIDNFEFRILEEVPEDMLDVRERSWIYFYKSNQREFGYNLESGGNLNKHHATETILKLSAIRGEKHWGFGKHRSEETRRKISDAHKGMIINLGHRHSEESKRKMTMAHKGRIRGPQSEEHKKKISIANLGKKMPPFSEKQKRNMSLVHKDKPWSEARRIAQNNRS
jgi:group I intron endonuclease